MDNITDQTPVGCSPMEARTKDKNSNKGLDDKKKT